VQAVKIILMGNPLFHDYLRSHACRAIQVEWHLHWADIMTVLTKAWKFVGRNVMEWDRTERQQQHDFVEGRCPPLAVFSEIARSEGFVPEVTGTLWF
jgi:hypothetical protein